MEREHEAREQLELRVARMEKQAVLDQDLIARLLGEGRSDKRRIVDLESQARVDADLVAALTAEGVVERKEN